MVYRKPSTSRSCRRNVLTTIVILVLPLQMLLPAVASCQSLGISGTTAAGSGRVAHYLPHPAQPMLLGTAKLGATSGPHTLALSESWVNVTPGLRSSPPPVLWDSMTSDPVDRLTLLFGGCNDTVCPMPAQTWGYANGSWENLTAESVQPPARSYATMAFDGASGYALLFGGATASATLNDSWSFAGGIWTDLSVASGRAPPARWGGSLVYDPIGGYLVLFGGSSASGAMLADTWAYANDRWTNLTATAGPAPPARIEATMVWDANDQEIVLADGCGSPRCPLNDTWAFQGGRWTDISGTASPMPPARYLAMMSYDYSAGFALLFGGYDGAGARGDSWMFENNHWSDLTASLAAAPSPRGASAIMEDTASYPPAGTIFLPYVLMYGGDHIPCSTCPLAGIPETWIFEIPPTAAVTFSPNAPNVGEPVSFTAQTTGGTPPYAYSWSFGDGSIAQGLTVIHSFVSARTYVGQLVATDAAGAHAMTNVVVIVANPPPSRFPGFFSPIVELAVGLAAAAIITVAAFVVMRRPRPRHPDSDRTAVGPPTAAAEDGH